MRRPGAGRSGLPQAFLEHGSRGQVLADAGLTEQDVARRIAEWTAELADRAEPPRRRAGGRRAAVIAEIQVAPSPPGTADNPHAHVEAAIAVIQARACATRWALGTTLEGDDDAVWAPCGPPTRRCSPPARPAASPTSRSPR